MQYHVLTGDCLAEVFKGSSLTGEVIICRECLVEGPVNASSEERFWHARAQYLSRGSKDESDFYYRAVKGEFDKIREIPADSEINLWFEHDLFCQVNYWFIINLLDKLGHRKVYRVSPKVLPERLWAGFGDHSPEDLRACFDNRVRFAKGDFNLGVNLWNAFKESNLTGLAIYSKSLSPCFRRLDEVCRAEVDRKRNARPQKALAEIMSKGYTSFSDIFSQFSKREGIYGFGDAQVDHLLKTLRA